MPPLTDAPQIPVALIRSRPAGYAWASRPRLPARTAALAAPWAIRAAVKVAVESASAPSAVVRPRASVPRRKTRRRPYASARPPARRRRAARPSGVPLSSQAWAEGGVPKAAATAGRVGIGAV